MNWLRRRTARFNHLSWRSAKAFGTTCSSYPSGWTILVASAVLCLGTIFTGETTQAETTWRVGLARELITPKEFMWMSGYGGRNRPADGKLSDLWAKAIAIEDSDGKRVVLVTLDLIGIDRQTVEIIHKAVQNKFQLPRSSLAISTSHTHSGPVVGENLRAMYQIDESAWGRIRHYTDGLVNTVIDVVGRSIADLRSTELFWTVGRAKFAVNRRNNREADVPSLRADSRLLGPVDHDVPILVAKEPTPNAASGSENPLQTETGGKLRAIICGYACHATVLSGYQWCGDWPGYAQEQIESRFPEATAMVWIGCGADQNPLPRRDVKLAKQYGLEMGDAVSDALERPLVKIDGALDSVYAEIPLAYANLPSLEELEHAMKSENRFEASRARRLLEAWHRDGGLAQSYPYPIQTWRLGNGPTWLFLGGEVVIDYALRLKLELGSGKTWVAGYCNDVMAYIPSLRVLKEGGYEGGGSMVYYGLPSPWSDSIEEEIVAEARRQVSQLGGPSIDSNRRIVVKPYPDHGDLTKWCDQAGDLREIQTPDDWGKRRGDILSAAQSVMGRLPGEEEMLPLKITIRESEDFDGYTRQLITYSVDGDGDATAHLYLPKQVGDRNPNDASKRLPGVLALHPTSALGKRIVAGEGPRPNRNYGAELAERGYVVLAPDYPSFGELDDYDFHNDRYLSGTMRAIVNHRRGIELLVNHDLVDPDRIGAIGHSLGGHNAIFVAAFDDRIKAVVSSCGWDPFHYYYDGRLAGWASDRYMPRIREIHGLNPDRMPFDFPELIAALAPRAFFSCSPLKDSNFQAKGVAEAEPKIRAIYELMGAADRLVIRYPDAGHDFPTSTRLESYRFLDRVLKPDTESPP